MEDRNNAKLQKRIRFKKSDFRHHLFIESYGVKIGVTSNTAEGINEARKVVAENLPNCFREIDKTTIKHHFKLFRNPSEQDSLYKNGEKILTRTKRRNLTEALGSRIRITVAEFAVKHVFIHAGVVSWRGNIIIIPGKSFSGKTTLTAALIKRGALYYSDEYAVLDEEGYVHPFPKPLSVRGEIDDYTQVEYTPEGLGGKVAKEKGRVQMVLITKYKPNANWDPKIITKANGMFEIIKNTVPIRINPAFVLNTLKKITEDAVILKLPRGDVSTFVDLLIDYLDSNLR